MYEIYSATKHRNLHLRRKRKARSADLITKRSSNVLRQAKHALQDFVTTT